MKKLWKRMTGLLFIGCLFALILSVTAGAEPLYPKTQYYYLNEKGGEGQGQLTISGLPFKQKLAKSSIKSSNPAVVKVSGLSQSQVTTEEDQFGKLPTSGIQYKNGYTVELSFTRSGTSKISFKSGNKTYTSTVRVLPYTKPLSSLTISGIKNGTTTNLAGKFAKGHWVSVKQPKTQNNGQISIKAASGWKIISAYYMAEGRNRMLTSERGLNSVTLFAGRMPAGESFRSLTMKFRNSKNGAVIECICQID